MPSGPADSLHRSTAVSTLSQMRAAGGFYGAATGHLQGFAVTDQNGTWGKAIEIPGQQALNNCTAAVESLSCGLAVKAPAPPGLLLRWQRSPRVCALDFPGYGFWGKPPVFHSGRQPLPASRPARRLRASTSSPGRTLVLTCRADGGKVDAERCADPFFRVDLDHAPGGGDDALRGRQPETGT